ncbi:hypothetical protein Mgra_00005380 [Meloidogyne graminicola]|uniref:Uncharacterized protein n=1 Tax=Meloidogyne graminicola TaxID=189291 RepID=A0A8S9ZP97_9BILA|nr:hypothetical protein Mgra_00005380 [Meloidogyne graminicola]
MFSLYYLIFFVFLIFIYSSSNIESSEIITNCHKACGGNTKCATNCVTCTNKKCKNDCKDGFFSKAGSGAKKQKCIDCANKGIIECSKKN